MQIALKTLALSFRDLWQELWTALVVHLLFLLGCLLVIPGPPAALALFYFGNRIAHEEVTGLPDFLHAIRRYWAPAWRWGLLNLLVLALLAGDYYFTGMLAGPTRIVRLLQGLYLTLLAVWLVLQIFLPPFLFEQQQPSVLQALRNAFVFVGRNLGPALLLVLLLTLVLAAGIFAFMLTFVFGGALIVFASNRLVLQQLERDTSARTSSPSAHVDS